MRLRSLYLALAFALLFAFNPAYSQDALGPQPKRARTPADYELRTLKEIRSVGAGLVKEQADGTTTLIHGNLFPSRIRVTYKGPVRALSPKRKEVIYQWAQRYAGAPIHYTGPYTTEALFTEMGVDHWLVVKSEDIPRLKKSVRPGRTVDLHLIRLGAFKVGETWHWVLLVEDFASKK
jgi:hypothetical protein